jgi:hypothetical protein
MGWTRRARLKAGLGDLPFSREVEFAALHGDHLLFREEVAQVT